MRKTVVIIACVLMIASIMNRDAFKEDISKRTVVQGVGIDLNDDGTYTVTLETINTENYSNADGTASPVMNIRTLSGKTVYSAIKSAYSIDGKTPLMSQNRVIIIGKSLAEKNIIPALDFFIRDAENYPSVLIAMAETSAEDFFKKSTNDSSVVSRNVERIILTAQEDLTVSSISLCELVNRYKDGASSFYMPIMSVEKVGEKANAVSKGTAIFKNGKLSLTLNEPETVCLNFLCNKAKKGAIDISVNGVPAAVSIIKSQTMRKLDYQSDFPRFNIEIKATADLAELSDKTISSITDKDINKIETNAEIKLKSEIQDFCEKIYKVNKTDPVGLSRLIFIYYPEKYRQQKENLNEIMTQGQYNVEVDIKIRRVGQDYSS